MRKFGFNIAVFVAALLSFVGLVAADGGSCGMTMMGAYGPGMMFFGWVTYLLVIALIIAAIYWLVVSANKRR